MEVNILTLNQSGFPDSLRNIATPPKQIYWVGMPFDSWLDKPKVAIVGSRKVTPYGHSVTSKIATELARLDIVVISGLAYGVDITAHRAVLSVGGTTIAVLPTGLDNIYPAAHGHVAAQITEKGTLITEYPAGTEGFKSNFIARNRLVSGLCDVLLITEAAVNSGSLHTARFALEQGKTVMAVPGNITNPISEGCNNLIKSGAIPTTSVEDVIFALKLNPKSRRSRGFDGSALEKIILDLIEQGISSQDALAAASELEGPALASALTMLEISGHIRPVGGGNWTVA